MSLLEFCLMPGQEAVFHLTRHLGLQAFRYPKGTATALGQAYEKWNAAYQAWRQRSNERPGNVYERAWFREIRETCRLLRQRLLESELAPITGGPSTTLYSVLDTQTDPIRATARRHKLLIIPHITAELPLHACIDNVGHALIQKYDMGFIHSANLLRKLLERQRFIREAREGQKNKRVLLINDPKKGHPEHHWRWSLESPRALGEPTEAHAIRRLYDQAGAQVDFLEGDSATVANVQGHLESHYYDNVIFSGHSVYDFSQPWDSCLLLYDAPLFLKHIAQWSLKGIGNLALFSCESKLGKPDFLQNSVSIATVFMILGVESVIASQWAVGLQTTKDFMKRTYTLHLEARLRLAEAFCQAQRERAEMEEPFDWAGFIWSGVVS
jgi:CHAT domain-containing protein